MAYKTRQSACILQLLEENKDKHLTAEEIYSLLKETDHPVGQTTVYRQLDKLSKEGRVRKYARGDQDGACYQFAEHGPRCEHYHLKCTSCGKLFHADCDFLQELSAHIQKEHGFQMDCSKTIFYGVCAECAKEKSST